MNIILIILIEKKMANFYEFVLYVQLNEEVDKKTIELSNYNNIYRIKYWSDLDTDVEDVKVREITFESQYNIYNYILEKYTGHKINRLIGYVKTPLYV